MSVAFRKIIGDLRDARGQVFLLFAAILIGQAAMTAAFMAKSVIGAEIDRNFAMARAAEVTVEAANFDGTALGDLERLPGVDAIDSVTTLFGRYRLADGSWRPIMLYGRRDFEDLRVAKIFRKSGTWPRAGEVLIERSGLGIAEKLPGEAFDISFGRGNRLSLAFAGVVHDPMQAPSWQENTIYGYTDMATLTRLAGPRPVQLRVLLGLDAQPAAVARSITESVVAKGGRIVRISLVPATHPHADLMAGLLMLLSVFSILAYALALFLASSIVAAFAQRQERQLAVLRALGASRSRIALMHLGSSLIPSIAALVLGAALGEAAGSWLQIMIANQLNIEILNGDPSNGARLGLLIAGGAGIAIALIVPISASVRKTVREVLQTGLKGQRRPWLSLSLLQPLDRLAVAEAFQRPIRTGVTIAALTVAGIALLSSANTFSSLVGMVDRMLETRHDTFTAVMSDRPNLAVLEPRLRAIDGMERYELWDRKLVTLSTPGGSTPRGPLYAPPEDTRMGHPSVVSGRWPSGPGEIAISQMAHGYNASLNLGLGRSVTLTADGTTTEARIVGFVDEWGMSVWASPATFDTIAVPEDRGRELRATTSPGKADEALASAERAIIEAGSFPLASSTRDTFRSGMVNHFFSFYQYLLIASLTAAFVGAAALSATIGSNILGRTREIGVLRALGIDSGSLYRLVLIQAVAVAVVSLLLAVTISMPLSAWVVRLMADNFVHMAIPLTVSWTALAGLGVGALVLASLAAVAPAIRARRLAIRQALTYE